MRGKSLTPVSRMEMEESSNCMLERREDTQPSRELAMMNGAAELPLSCRLRVNWSFVAAG